LQPTSPLRNANDIDKAIIKIVNKKALCLISVYRSKIPQKFPININKKLISKVRINSKKNNNYYLNGAIYIANINYFIKKKSFYSKKSIPFFMLKKRSIDVDNIKEFNQAKKYLKK
jgi:CMP-N-acetylneuraminic acid synthetase